MIDKYLSAISTVLKDHPSFLTVLLVVCAFLFFMDRQSRVFERRLALDEIVAEQRIEACHDIQDRGIDTIDRLSDVLLSHERQFVAMQTVFEEVMQSNADMREDVRRLLTLMEQHAYEHRKPNQAN